MPPPRSLSSPQAARGAKGYEKRGLSEDEIEEIREAFNLFDTDGSGECKQEGRE